MILENKSNISNNKSSKYDMRNIAKTFDEEVTKKNK